MKRPAVVNLGSYRENLIYEVRRTVNEAEKDRSLRELLAGQLQDGPGLVYVATIREAKALFERLRRVGLPVGLYHGKMSAKDRHKTQQEFMDNRFRLVVATKAFGLGIDKRDLRVVVHYSLPDSIESYVQETGRAGRDGKAAWAVLFYRLEDRQVQAYFLGGKYPRREDCADIYRALAEEQRHGNKGVTLNKLAAATALPIDKVKVIVALLDAIGIVGRGRRLKLARAFGDEDEFGRYLAEYEERHKSDQEKLEAMMKYGQTTECRVRFLTRYFGNELPKDCGRCDNCRTADEHRVVDVRNLQSGIRRSLEALSPNRAEPTACCLKTERTYCAAARRSGDPSLLVARPPKPGRNSVGTPNRKTSFRLSAPPGKWMNPRTRQAA
jgi:ATP-dependent DNA helicase RecQ